MEFGFLKRLLWRIQRKDIVSVLSKWGFLARNQLDMIGHKVKTSSSSFNKSALIDFIIKEANKTDLHMNDVGNLNLTTLLQNPRQVLWTAFKLDEFYGDGSHSRLSVDVFKTKLANEISIFYDSTVCVVEDSGAYWIWIYINSHKTDTRTALSAASYMVHVPGSNYVFVAKFKAKLASCIMQTMMNVLGYARAAEMPLTGHCIASLVELTVNKQGAKKKTRLPKGNVAQKGQPKRVWDLAFRDSTNVVDEDGAKKKRKLEQLEESLGTGEQPTLEKVTYRLETKFHGHRFAPAMTQHDGIFRCHVQFEGASVLEGIKGLGFAELAELPLKNHVGNITSLTRNSFVITQKSRNSENSLRN